MSFHNMSLFLYHEIYGNNKTLKVKGLSITKYKTGLWKRRVLHRVIQPKREGVHTILLHHARSPLTPPQVRMSCNLPQRTLSCNVKKVTNRENTILF